MVHCALQVVRSCSLLRCPHGVGGSAAKNAVSRQRSAPTFHCTAIVSRSFASLFGSASQRDLLPRNTQTHISLLHPTEWASSLACCVTCFNVLSWRKGELLIRRDLQP